MGAWTARIIEALAVQGFIRVGHSDLQEIDEIFVINNEFAGWSVDVGFNFRTFC